MKELFGTFLVVIMCNCSFLLGPDPENSPKNNFEIFWREFDQKYAYFQYSGVCWDSIYHVYRPMVNYQTSDSSLLNIFGEIITALNDKHLMVFDINTFRGINTGPFGSRTVKPSVHSYYLGVPQHSCSNRYITYGKLLYNIGYMYVPSMNIRGISLKEWGERIDHVLERLSDTQGLIVDIRDNHGGTSENAEALAARFVDSSIQYMKIRYRNGPRHDQFTEYQIRTVRPGGVPYRNRTVILTDSATGSAAEWFTLAVRTAPHVVHGGYITAGAIGTTRTKRLPNRFDYTVTYGQAVALEDSTIQGRGIYPHVFFHRRSGVVDAFIEDAKRHIRLYL